MTTITIEEIQCDLIGYLQRVAGGETLLVMQVDKAVAEIKPASQDAGAKQLRPIGLAAGDFVVPDDFDAPLPHDFLG